MMFATDRRKSASSRVNDLRRRLSRWDRVSREAVDGEEVVRDYNRSVVVPFLAARGVPIGRVLAVWREDTWGLARAGDGEAAEIYRSLLRDPEFRMLAIWRYDWALASVDDTRELLEEVEGILALVGAEPPR